MPPRSLPPTPCRSTSSSTQRYIIFACSCSPSDEFLLDILNFSSDTSNRDSDLFSSSVQYSFSWHGNLSDSLLLWPTWYDLSLALLPQNHLLAEMRSY
jgi:hypothetical protein